MASDVFVLLLSVVLIYTWYVLGQKDAQQNTAKVEKALISSIAPKGLATAVLADIPLHMHFPESISVDWLEIRSLAYAIILFSLILTSLLIYLQENHLIDDKIDQYL